jgi:hypothetical protein
LILLGFLLVWTIWVTGWGNKLLSLITNKNDIGNSTSIEDYALELEVKELFTKYSKANLAPKYPSSIKVRLSEEYVNQIQAFGVAETTVLGPKGWGGYGVGMDNGQKEGYLYPEGGRVGLGEYIRIIMGSSCGECSYQLASPYFPNARVWLKNNSYSVNVSANDMVISNKSGKLVTYKSLLKNSEGMYTSGVAYFDENITGTNPAVPYFIKFETVMSEKHQDLSDLLIETFIKRKDLK